MLSGVSPCGICHISSPRSRLIAASMPYGGLTIGSPCTLSPSAAPPPAGAAAGAGGCLLRRPLRRVGGAAVARPQHLPEVLARDAGHVSDIREPFRRRDERSRASVLPAGA